MTDKYEEVWSGIRSEIKTINGKKGLFYERNYSKIGINIDDDLPLNKPLKYWHWLLDVFFIKVKNCNDKFM